MTGRSSADMAAELESLDIQLNGIGVEQDEQEEAANEEDAAIAEGKGDRSTPTRTSTS